MNTENAGADLGGGCAGGRQPDSRSVPEREPCMTTELWCQCHLCPA